MDKHNSWNWKRTEEAEVDLIDLLHRLCGQWKQVVACALLMAVLLGGYGWTKGISGSDTEPVGSEEVTLTEEEEQGVTAAIQLKEETDSLKEYLDNSILMRVDPYHKNKATMLYCIEGAKHQELQKITESYLNYISNGSAADALRASTGSRWQIDKSYLAELMAAYQKTYSAPYQIMVEGEAGSSMLSEALFYVEVTGENSNAAKQMAKDIQDVLRIYSDEVIKTVGKHKLSLVSSALGVAIDNGLQSQQHDKKVAFLSNQANLKAMSDAFHDGQLAVYQSMAGIEEDGSKLEDGFDNGNADAKNVRQGIKYMIIGLAGGIFVYCGIFSCWYISKDIVKSAEEIKRMYIFPFYGRILLNSNGRRLGCRKIGELQDTYGNGEAQALNRIRMACKKKGVSQLSAASDFIYSQHEKACLERIAGQLKGLGIEMAVVENAVVDTAVWDGLEQAGYVLIVCRIGTTTHRMIDDAVGFYLENGVGVIGVVAFSQDG